MVTDLKVLVKSFNCEDRFCYIGNLRDSFFRAREKNIFIRETFAKLSRKWDIRIILFVYNL